MSTGTQARRSVSPEPNAFQQSKYSDVQFNHALVLLPASLFASTFFSTLHDAGRLVHSFLFPFMSSSTPPPPLPHTTGALHPSRSH